MTKQEVDLSVEPWEATAECNGLRAGERLRVLGRQERSSKGIRSRDAGPIKQRKANRQSLLANPVRTSRLEQNRPPILQPAHRQDSRSR
jgi:hypothetical protein